jgi:hypothetical protein
MRHPCRYRERRFAVLGIPDLQIGIRSEPCAQTSLITRFGQFEGAPLRVRLSVADGTTHRAHLYRKFQPEVATEPQILSENLRPTRLRLDSMRYRLEVRYNQQSSYYLRKCSIKVWPGSMKYPPRWAFGSVKVSLSTASTPVPQ